MEHIGFNAELDVLASLFENLTPSGIRILRLAVDYKNPQGADCYVDMLTTVPPGMTTSELVQGIRSSLPAKCKLSAITSVDYMRPLYIAPGILEETIMEQGLQVPDNLKETMASLGLNPLKLEDMK